MAAVVTICGRNAGSFLVRDIPAQADVIVALAGDANDKRYQRALELLGQGLGGRLLVDASADSVEFGRTRQSLAEEFVSRTAGRMKGRVAICPIYGNSTNEETKHVAACLEPLHPSSVMIVTSDFHTRRALAIFRKRLPQYRWCAAASRDTTRFGARWWTRREWAKTAVEECVKFFWWEAVDRWRPV